MDTLDADLLKLEQLLRKLEFEYDQFFSGQVRAEPQRTDSDVQKVIKIYSGKAIQNQGHRFKYTNLVARYNSFRKVWTRKVRELEEGRVIGRPWRMSKTLQVRGPGAAVKTSRRHEFIAKSLGECAKDAEEIFNNFKQLREESGEPTERLRLESFTRILEDKISKIKEMRQCDKVEIRLRREKEKTRILVRPYRSKE